MIEFHYELDFELARPEEYQRWIEQIFTSEGVNNVTIGFIFCDDDYLLKINKEYLGHDYFTDVISFQYSENQDIRGDIFISVDRIKENAKHYEAEEDHELKRVMAHGALHLLGYNDKTEAEATVMKAKENEKIEMFHVEQ